MGSWWALSPPSKKDPILISTTGLPVWSLHVRPMSVWLFSYYSGFLPQSENMNV